MSEAIIIEAIQKLQGFMVETPTDDDKKTGYRKMAKEIIVELRTVLDFLIEKEPGERSRLDYLLADLAEIAQDSADLTTVVQDFFFNNKLTEVLDFTRKTRKRMTEFGAGERVTGELGAEGVVVGFEKDVQQLIGRAIPIDRQTLVTVCIKGMVGVGKTTLARQVYNHPAVVEKFKHRAWVTISSYTSANEVLVELMHQLMGRADCRVSDNRSLQQMLQQNLEGKPYIVVLDNVPKEMYFKSILRGLQTGEGSRLLITSRYQITDGIYYTHKMKTLDSEKSWKLLLKTIDTFTGNENKFSKDMERKGKEMLKKCGGLPLAIVDVGRQKAKQILSGTKWEELFDSIDLSETLKLLEPMYDGLDEELKACFLYMSFFKENAIMRQEKLEQIWTINIQRSIIEVMLTRAYNLVKESIIEVVHDFQFNFEVKRLHINPLLHMLSIKIAEKELGFEILRNDGNDRPSQSPRHRVIHCGRGKFSYSTNQDKNLISLIFHGGGGYLEDASPSYWRSFELLSLLDLEDFGVKTLSESIGTLIELRYLGLRNNYIQEIPHSLEGLKKLEVLDIALNFMVNVPDIIHEMGSLRFLYMSDVIPRKPLKVDALQNLETLTYISIYDWTYEVLTSEKMTSLVKLGIDEIDENSHTSKLFASLAMLKRFRTFNLRGFRIKSMPCLDEIGVLDSLYKLRLDGRLARLPSAIGSHRWISYFVLVNTCLDEDPMQVLQKMRRLKVIKLRNAYTGRQMVIAESSLKSLRILRINELWNLRDVRVEGDGMSFLQQLEIKNCPHLDNLPKWICWMRFLKKFSMVTTKHIATKIRNSRLISNILEVDISP